MFFALLLSAFSLWGESIPKMPDINQYLSPPKQPCNLCEVEKSDPPYCEDLFSYVCLLNGKNRYGDEIKRLYEENDQRILAMKDRVAKKLGGTDLKDLIIKRLEAKGIKVKESGSKENWKAILDGNLDEVKRSHEFYEVACHHELDALEKEVDLKSKNKKRLKDAYLKLEEVKRRSRERLIEYYAQDINLFVKWELSHNCKSKYKEDYNQALKTVCDDFPRIVRESLLVSKKGLDERIDFIRRNFPPSVVSKEEGEAFKKGEVPYYRTALNAVFDAEIDVCQSERSAIVADANEIITKTHKEVQLSKDFMSELYQAYYGNKKDRMISMFENAKKRIIDLLPDLTNDSVKRKRIENEYQKLNLAWREVPTDSKFKKGAEGIDHYIEDNGIEKEGRQVADDIYDELTDITLSDYRYFNASYGLQFIHGNKLTEERVNLSPFLQLFLDGDPAFVEATLIHELTHKIGPDLSKSNGHDISLAYTKTLECYAEDQSIRGQEKQSKEIISDAFAAAILGERLQTMSAEDGRKNIFSMVKKFCYYDHAEKNKYHADLSADHPDNYYRVNGIMGTTPSIRKALGCNGPSRDFKTCELPGFKERK